MTPQQTSSEHLTLTMGSSWTSLQLTTAEVEENPGKNLQAT